MAETKLMKLLEFRKRASLQTFSDRDKIPKEVRYLLDLYLETWVLPTIDEMIRDAVEVRLCAAEKAVAVFAQATGRTLYEIQNNPDGPSRNLVSREDFVRYLAAGHIGRVCRVRGDWKPGDAVVESRVIGR